jgi:feruloyl esterase
MMKNRITGLRTSALCPLLGLGMLGGIAAAPSAEAATACSTAALTALNVQNMTITSATDIPFAYGSQAYCRVIGHVRTDGEGAGVNQAGFQIDLPSFWNGKFLFLGGGGLDGFLQDGTPQQVAKGYATASTDSGHTVGNGTFAITAAGVPNEPALIDYFYRSRHQVGIAAKGLVQAFYNARKIAYSYFDGCSNGGKEALMEASRYPNDYDGIIAGAPWMDPVGTELWSVKNVRALLRSYIPPSLYSQINAAIIGQCDAADGVRDGLIQNPARCAFEPNSLVPSVLTQAQADAIKTIIAPVTDTDGNLIYPGSPVSDLFAPYGPTQYPVDENSTPAPNPTNAQPWGAPPLAIFQTSPLAWYEAYNIIDLLGLYQPNYDLNSDAFEKNGVVPVATRKLLYSNLRLNLADNPALVARFLAKSYLNKGGKLIMYHGYSDPVISPYRSVLFYESLAGLAGGYTSLQESARLFMVPDMGHCINGSGPDNFGNLAEPAGYPVDAQHDLLSALEEWVEYGTAPPSIIASHYTGDNPTTGSVDRTMPLCPFPTEARYTGSGNVNDAASWSCRPNTGLLQTGVNGRQAGVYGPSNQPAFPSDVIGVK